MSLESFECGSRWSVRSVSFEEDLTIRMAFVGTGSSSRQSPDRVADSCSVSFQKVQSFSYSGIAMASKPSCDEVFSPLVKVIASSVSTGFSADDVPPEGESYRGLVRYRVEACDGVIKVSTLCARGPFAVYRGVRLVS
jgi:hypothetical protein